jgi:hypothetical protein
MGLDSIWINNGGSDNNNGTCPDFVPPLSLCGGILSGNGADSFRGKVYSCLISEVTGESLYQEEIPSDKIKGMAEKLNSASYNELWINEFGVKYSEFIDLQRMFKKYSEAGFSLYGWW